MSQRNFFSCCSEDCTGCFKARARVSRETKALRSSCRSHLTADSAPAPVASHPRAKATSFFPIQSHCGGRWGSRRDALRHFSDAGYHGDRQLYFLLLLFSSKPISQFLAESASEQDLSHFLMRALELFLQHGRKEGEGEGHQVFPGAVLHCLSWLCSLVGCS